MAAKQAKIPQTDWTRGGRDISNTAIPLYQENLTRMGDYLADPQAAMDSYLSKYYGSNAIQNQDFLRAYNRQIAQQMGNNFAATGGGYTSSGERALMDRQKALNDLAARLNQYGVKSSYDMANQDFQNMRGANADYYAAYGLGQPYSQNEQYNALADQQNKNWSGNALSGIGNAAMAIAPFTGAAAPFVAAAGALASGIGSATSIDATPAMAAIYGGNPAAYGAGRNTTFTNLANQLGQYDWGKIFNRSSQSANQQINTPTSALNQALANATNSGYNIPNKI